MRNEWAGAGSSPSTACGGSRSGSRSTSEPADSAHALARRRNRIRFGRHTGFVKLALEAGVPVVPMTIHGAHQSTFVLTRGHWIARLTGIDRLHINVFPFVWNIPLGLMPAFVPSVVLPSKVTVQLGAPLDWSHHGPARADDPVVLRACYEEITGIMQADLDALARERPYPVLDRIQELARYPWAGAGVDASKGS